MATKQSEILQTGNKTTGGIVSRRVLFVAVTSLGLGILFDILFYGKLPGVSFPLYIILVLTALTGLARNFRVRLPEAAWLLMLPLLFFSGMVAVRASGFVTFLNIATSLYLLLAIAWITFRPQLREYRSGDYVAPLLKLPAHLFVKWKETLGEATTARQVVRRHPLVPQILRGIVIALPILFLFGMLFSSADLVFRKYLTDVFGFSVDMSIVHRLFWIVVTASFFMGWLAYALQKRAGNHSGEAAQEPAGQSVIRKLGPVEFAILFGSLNVLFAGFIIVQLAYMFGGEQNVLSAGFTYAEYARKGFFELIAVALLSFGVISIAEKALVRDDARHSLSFRILAGLLIAQVMVVMVSAFQRLGLYESAYGFTALRLYSHLALIWLAVIFGLLFYKIVRQRPERVFAFWAFIACLLLLGTINVMNVDSFVARKNIERYHKTGKIDAYYLGRLSEDAVPETAKLLEARDARVRDQIAPILRAKRIDMQETNRHWQSANLARTKALDALDR